MSSEKTTLDVMAFTRAFAGADYTSITEPALAIQVPNPNLEGATVMTKFVLAAVAALSILASPVLAGPGGGSWDDIVQKSGDFQLQGR